MTEEALAHFFLQIGRKYRRGRCKRLVQADFDRGPDYKGMYLMSRITAMSPFVIGGHMEDTVQLLKATNEEALESKKILEGLKNQIDALVDIVEPALVDQITRLRTHRMSLVSELRQSLTMLQDVRKFFLEADYEKEMERLERFVSLGERLRQLKSDGTLDAVCDSALRLAVKEDRP